MSSGYDRPKIGRTVWIWRRYRQTTSGQTGYWERCRVETAGRASSSVRSQYGYLLVVNNEDLHDEPVR